MEDSARRNLQKEFEKLLPCIKVNSVVETIFNGGTGAINLSQDSIKMNNANIKSLLNQETNKEFIESIKNKLYNNN